MMKNILALVLAAVCFAFSACANGEKLGSGAAESGTTSTTAGSETGGITISRPPNPDETQTNEGHTVRTTRPPAGKTTKQTTATTAQPRTVRIVIPEGYTVSQIGERLAANRVCKKTDFLQMVNEYPFDLSRYSLVKAIPDSARRCYRLEGYLYPDTYDFYINMKPQDAIGVMLRGAESKIGSRYKYSGMSTDRIITLASVIEREAARSEDMKKVSSVFHNRLAVNMKLEADSTITYIEKHVKPNLPDIEKNRYNSYYNTYKCAALPEGPICNPGVNALSAAVNPANTDFLYFVSDKKGNYYFAKTYDEHKENLVKAGYITATTVTTITTVSSTD